MAMIKTGFMPTPSGRLRMRPYPRSVESSSRVRPAGRERSRRHAPAGSRYAGVEAAPPTELAMFLRRCQEGPMTTSPAQRQSQYYVVFMTTSFDSLDDAR